MPPAELAVTRHALGTTTAYPPSGLETRFVPAPRSVLLSGGTVTGVIAASATQSVVAAAAGDDEGRTPPGVGPPAWPLGSPQADRLRAMASETSARRTTVRRPNRGNGSMGTAPWSARPRGGEENSAAGPEEGPSDPQRGKVERREHEA